MEQSTVAPAAETTGRAHRDLHRMTGVAGVAALVLTLVPIILASGKEPDFGGTPAEIVRFFRSVSTPAHEFGSFVTVVGLLALLWFFVGLAATLSTVEGRPAWRSGIAAGSGAVVVALLLGASWNAASYRAEDLDPNVATYAFDLGNLAFANAWVALGSFTIACGAVILRFGRAPRWLGWWPLVTGVLFVGARAVWTSSVWFLPYALFWVWVVVVSVKLMRGTSGLGEEHPER